MIKFALGAIGVTALTYLVARERTLLRKTAHDCDKIKLKQVNMRVADSIVVVLCTLLVGGVATAKVYKQKICSEKPVVLEVCTPTYCYEQLFYNVKKYENKTDPQGRKFIRIYGNDGTITDVSSENKTVKVKK